MKTKFLLTLMSAVALIMSSCDSKKSEPTPSPITPEEQDPIKEQLVAKYNNVTGFKSVQKGQYTVATFVSNNLPMEAWFDNNNGKKWALTETKLTFDTVPQKVKDGFMSTDYSTWKVDDIDYVERPGMEPMYVIEAEQGDREAKLYYTSHGRLIKTLLEHDDDTQDYNSYLLPNVDSMPLIYSYLDKYFPQAKILEIDQEDNYIEVEILFGFKHYELLFHPNGTWFNTKPDNGDVDDHAYKQVSQEARDAIGQYIAQNYSGAAIMDINYVQESQNVYEVEILYNYVKIDLLFDSKLELIHTESEAPNLTKDIRETILKYITHNYPNAVIIEIEEDDANAQNIKFNVAISHENAIHDVIFDASGKFIKKQTYA